MLNDLIYDQVLRQTFREMQVALCTFMKSLSEIVQQRDSFNFRFLQNYMKLSRLPEFSNFCSTIIKDGFSYPVNGSPLPLLYA